MFDARGRHLAVLHDGVLGAGSHPLTLEAAGWPGGVYLVRAEGASGSQSRRVVLLR